MVSTCLIIIIYSENYIKTEKFKRHTPPHIDLRKIRKKSCDKKMASQTEKNFDPIETLACDACKSTNIIETSQGYVCGNCGIVLEVPKLEYHRPYNEVKIQNAPLQTTQIGFKHERLRSSRSPQIIRLNKLQNITAKTNEENSYEMARQEISRLMETLGYHNFSRNLEILKTVKVIWNKLDKGTKFRNMEKLVPAVIYVFCKSKGISINLTKLLENSKLSKEESKGALLTVIRHEKELSSAFRDKKMYCRQKIMNAVKEFGLGMEFYHKAVAFMERLWEVIKNTKEEVIAGLACSVIVLTPDYKQKISVAQICDKVGIRMSTVQGQVKKNIIEKFNVPGFTSLVASSQLITQILDKLGIIENPSEKLESEENKEDAALQEAECMSLNVNPNMVQITPKLRLLESKNEISMPDFANHLIIFSVFETLIVAEIIPPKRKIFHSSKLGSKILRSEPNPNYNFNIYSFSGKGPPGPPHILCT